MEELTLDESFADGDGGFDLTLIVDGHKIRVWKSVLCLASPVFRAMLQSAFKEKDQAEVKLPGKKYKDFLEFLSCLYPDRLETVKKDTVYSILPLANEYQVKVLVKKCHALLVNLVKTVNLTDAIQICRHIQLAELYKLDDLRRICISAASDFKLEELDTACSKYRIPESVLIQIHRLARRKQEINKIDDDSLVGVVDIYYKRISYKDILLPQTDFQNYNYDSKSKVRATRLWHRYFQNDDERLEKMIKGMKGMVLADEVKEEYDLLPETMKRHLHVLFNYNQN